MVDLQLRNLQAGKSVKIPIMCDFLAAVRFAVRETDLGVLVCCDRREGSLREGEGLEDTPADAEQVVRLDDVEARVVAVHGVQNDLQIGRGWLIQITFFFCFQAHKYPLRRWQSIHSVPVHQGLQLSFKKSSVDIIW